MASRCGHLRDPCLQTSVIDVPAFGSAQSLDFLMQGANPIRSESETGSFSPGVSEWKTTAL